MIAQNGSVYFPSQYRSNPNRCTRGYTANNQKLNVYGSVASRQNWTWYWRVGTAACGDAAYDGTSGQYISGFLNSVTTYDRNLQYSPPPSYPVTGQYSIISWREVLTKP